MYYQSHPIPPQPNGYWPHPSFTGNWPPNPPSNWYRQITIREAMDIAQDRVPGEIVKVELEHEKGRLVYEVEIRTEQGVKYEIDVDVNTGQIVEIELD
ncbi:MAG TPA: PepSY domain-containing protein [Bacillota bacterium]|nr:PepSY domain-containing protein [Bacillota bacterium]